MREDMDSLHDLAKQLHDREHFVMMGPAYLMHMCDVASTAILALLDENDRLTNAITAERPIIVNLIEIGFNVETWGLKQRLAAIDAALARATLDRSGK